jgi:hypothetical protein
MARALDNTPEKSIRLSIIRTIEQQHRQFARMKRAQKKDILEKVADEIGGIAGIRESYSKEELIGLGKISNGILSLKEMAVLIEDRSRCVIRLESPTRQRSIQDPFLKKLDG